MEKQRFSIQVVALSPVPFLPLIHGLLRIGIEQDPLLAKSYYFLPPVFVTETFEEIIQHIKMPDILALSCYPWNFRKNMKIAQWFKANCPDSLVIAGGQVLGDWTGDGINYSSNVNIFIHGEGEVIFKHVLEEYLYPDPNWSLIKGISYWQGDHLMRTPSPDSPPEIEKSLSPYISGCMDTAITECYKRRIWFIALWETSRGCPNKCSFCQWGGSGERRIRQIADDRLASEIEFFAINKIEGIMLCDANFGILPRDIVITKQLIESKQIKDYPKRIRINFDKFCNDNVFEISWLLQMNNMHLGTTFSPQSMNPSTLKAISRRRISTVKFQMYQSRYEAENIPTYSEVILGLPLETRNSFIEGIGKLLQSGIYDIRGYELVLFPNLPISERDSLDRFGIKIQDKELYLVPKSTPEDERERIKMVIATSTMTCEEWVDCRVFLELIQTLHSGGYTRYISTHLHRKYKISYQQFYQYIINWGIKRPTTHIGKLIEEMYSLFRRFQEDSSIPQMQLIASQPKLLAELKEYGSRKGWRPDQWAWLRISSSQEQFFSEVRDILEDFPNHFGPELDDLIRFQRDILLHPNYDPEKGKISHYRYDWITWFQYQNELNPWRSTIHYRDTHMGLNKQFPLKTRDLRAFSYAAVGPSYPFLRVRHYMHQLNQATINYEIKSKEK